ncbi:TPR-like protein, partial [Fragilariopsis cylindrus CCMP1102]
EDTVSGDPYNVNAWTIYLEEIDQTQTQQNNAPSLRGLVQLRDMVGRRSVQLLPRSYKLWKLHWEFVLSRCHDLGGSSTVLSCFERAIVTLHKFPRVWMAYLEFAHNQQSRHQHEDENEGKNDDDQNDDIAIHPTQLRHLVNRALEAIPVTQHDKIWPVLLKYYQSNNASTAAKYIPKESKLSVLRRYVQYNPAATKEVADFLADDLGQWGEAALMYVDLLNHDDVRDGGGAGTSGGTSRPNDSVTSTTAAQRKDFSNIKSGTGALRYLPREMEGVLWSQLADAWIRRGEFQLARSVYEEAIESVSRVRDFTILMDAYLQFEEGLLEATMETEDLTARRPVLLNGVLLRQNPDDVGEWLKRARLYKENGQVHQAAAALEEGLKTVKARRTVGGNSNQMVLQLAKIYEEDCKEVAKSRNLFDRICNQWVYEFKNVDDLAECYVAWVELELRQETWDDALDIIRTSVIIPPFAPKWIRGLPKSLRLWDLLLDLEESLGTAQTTKDAYSRAIEQKVATPLHILNFATFLTEQKYFEESFSAYERGIELFQYPGVKLIWKSYLDSFLKRYGETKLERTRDLFQRCLDACPPEESTEFFLTNGKYEEEHGLTKRALGVYHQMCKTVPGEDKYTAYQLFIAKTAKYLGQTATRDIYQNAIQDLEDGAAAKLCLDFASMETSLQEFDRARAVLTYGAQMADPRRNEEYWKAWNEFEISHGNEETFREMLRIKRSVEASYST